MSAELAAVCLTRSEAGWGALDPDLTQTSLPTGPEPAWQVTSEDAAKLVTTGRARPAAGVQADAVFSEDRRFRYALTRCWASGPVMKIVMLNPSTAAESTDDPTVRRCVGFARAEGYAGLVVGNLFAWRSSDPSDLRTATDRVGPDNDEWLEWIISRPGPLVAAWGARADAGRVGDVLELIGTRDLLCLGVTRHGQPRHPLYVRADTALQPLLPLARLALQTETALQPEAGVRAAGR